MSGDGEMFINPLPSRQNMLWEMLSCSISLRCRFQGGAGGSLQARNKNDVTKELWSLVRFASTVCAQATPKTNVPFPAFIAAIKQNPDLEALLLTPRNFALSN